MKAFLLLLTLAASLLPWPASAATALLPGERHALMLRYAECVASRHPALVKRFLFERRDAEVGDFDKLGDVTCVKQAGVRDFRSFRAQSAALAGAWGELALKDVPAALEQRFAGLPPLIHARLRTMAEFDPKGRLNRRQFAALVESANRDRAVMVLGECVARAAPAASRALVATPFGSPEERAAANALAPALAGCIGAGTVKLLPQQLRAALAFNYLRLAAAADPSLKDRLF